MDKYFVRWKADNIELRKYFKNGGLTDGPLIFSSPITIPKYIYNRIFNEIRLGDSTSSIAIWQNEESLGTIEQEFFNEYNGDWITIYPSITYKLPYTVSKRLSNRKLNSLLTDFFLKHTETVLFLKKEKIKNIEKFEEIELNLPLEAKAIRFIKLLKEYIWRKS